MLEPIERDIIAVPPAHLAGGAPLSAERHEATRDDRLYREIADRRAQLENADILRRARAL